MQRKRTMSKFPLRDFCTAEAEFRLRDRLAQEFSGRALNNMIKALTDDVAEEFYDRSESWIDSDVLDEIVSEYLTKSDEEDAPEVNEFAIEGEDVEEIFKNHQPDHEDYDPAPAEGGFYE